MKKASKFLHTMGSIGLLGGIACYIILLSVAPPMSEIESYHAIRVGIDKIARWLLLPSLTIMLTSGLAAVAIHAAFREQRWVWCKILLGLSMFEGTLVSIQGPAQHAAKITAQALAGQIEVARIPELIHDERGALWVVGTLAVINVVLGVWRPRLKRRKLAAATAG
ncbi:MAG: hypothetical protein AB8B93_01750 [Pseudomonadales bacterium]